MEGRLDRNNNCLHISPDLEPKAGPDTKMQDLSWHPISVFISFQLLCVYCIAINCTWIGRHKINRGVYTVCLKARGSKHTPDPSGSRESERHTVLVVQTRNRTLMHVHKCASCCARTHTTKGASVMVADWTNPVTLCYTRCGLQRVLFTKFQKGVVSWKLLTPRDTRCLLGI